jgi:HSP20 family protein
MVLSRWDPYTQATSLREAMNRLFEESVIRPSALGNNGGDGAALDVCEEGESYIVEVALPGVKPENVEVSVLGNTVTIRGEWPARPEGRQYLHSERGGGRFERTITLPGEIDRDRVEAHAEHGVLRLALPKAEAARPKRIQLKIGS